VNIFASPTLRALDQQTQEQRAAAAEADNGSHPSFFPTLAGLVRRPQRVLFLWNWKAAELSIILRGPIFLAVAVRRGLAATVSAVLTECVFCAFTAGFYGAIVQNLRDAEPEWLTILFVTVILPGIFQALEYALHRFRGTPHLRIAEIVSIFVSGLSALFNWYAMRRGALLVGGEGKSFGSDLRRLPGLILRFLTALPAWLRERGRRSTDSSASSADSAETGSRGG
jgi:hypothetical protein